MSNAKSMKTPMHTYEVLVKDENNKKVYQMIYLRYDWFSTLAYFQHI